MRGAEGRTRLTLLLRLLILTQLAFNLGFFAVLPFLAEHLGQAMGTAGRPVGFVLGLRTFSQQGLFVVGGLPVAGVLLGVGLPVAVSWLVSAATTAVASGMSARRAASVGRRHGDPGGAHPAGESGTWRGVAEWSGRCGMRCWAPLACQGARAGRRPVLPGRPGGGEPDPGVSRAPGAGAHGVPAGAGGARGVQDATVSRSGSTVSRSSISSTSPSWTREVRHSHETSRPNDHRSVVSAMATTAKAAV